MNASLVLYQKNKALPKPPPAKRNAIRRIFNNEQIIERYDKWLLICGKAANTQRNYTSDARQFGKFLLDKPLTSATKEDVRAFIAEMYAKGRKPQTMQRKLDSLRVLFDCLQLGNQVRVSVPRLVSRRKLPQHLPRVMSEEEIKQIIAAARTPRDRAILELGYGSGLRVNELANLRIEDVNVKCQSLIVRTVRLGDYELPTRERARAALDAYLTNTLPRRKPDTKGMGKKGIYRVIVAAAKRAGLTGVHPHTLRHSMATHCLNHGMEIRHIQELLGYTSLVATQKYLHLSPVNLKRVHAKFFPRG